MPGLIDHCLAKLKECLQKQVPLVQQAFFRSFYTGTPVQDFLDQANFGGLVEGTRLAFESKLATLRQMWLDFFEATMYWAVLDDKIDVIIAKHPSFVARLKNDMLHHHGITPHNQSCRPDPLCGRCNRDPFSRRGGHYTEIWWVGGSGSEFGFGSCNRCLPYLRLFRKEPYQLVETDILGLPGDL